MFYWHATNNSDLESIMQHGLKAPVYVCNNPGSCLQIRNQQIEENDKSGPGTLLKVWLSDKYKLVMDEDTDYDAFVCNSDIPVNRITIDMPFI